MLGKSLQSIDLDSISKTNSLLKDPVRTKGEISFDEVLETQVKEVAQKVKDKAAEVVAEGDKTKKRKEKVIDKELFDVTKLTKDDSKDSKSLRNTYQLLDKFKDEKSLFEEKSSRQDTMNNATNAAYQAMVQPIHDQRPRQRRLTRADILAHWEKFTPSITEDITKRSVRIDIPLLNDVQALVLRMNPDKSLTASLLGSQIMGELIKQNKDKLNRNLKHHHLSLREFNTYTTEVSFNTESGTRKQKRQMSTPEKHLDLL